MKIVVWIVISALVIICAIPVIKTFSAEPLPTGVLPDLSDQEADKFPQLGQIYRSPRKEKKFRGKTKFHNVSFIQFSQNNKVTTTNISLSPTEAIRKSDTDKIKQILDGKKSDRLLKAGEYLFDGKQLTCKFDPSTADREAGERIQSIEKFTAKGDQIHGRHQYFLLRRTPKAEKKTLKLN